MKTYPDIPSLYAMQQMILSALLAAETRRLEVQLFSLCQKNSHLLGRTTTGFRYEGKTFITEECSRVTPFPLLHYDLLDDMEIYAKDRKAIESERSTIKQLLTKLLDIGMEAQQMRNALPECLIQFTPNFIKRLSRTKDQEAVMREDLKLSETTINQFHQWLPKIEMYAATHLLY